MLCEIVTDCGIPLRWNILAIAQNVLQDTQRATDQVCVFQLSNSDSEVETLTDEIDAAVCDAEVELNVRIAPRNEPAHAEINGRPNVLGTVTRRTPRTFPGTCTTSSASSIARRWGATCS